MLVGLLSESLTPSPISDRVVDRSFEPGYKKKAKLGKKEMPVGETP